MDVILGMEWMNQHKVILYISDRVIEINSPTVGHTTLYLPFRDGTDSCAYVTIVEDSPRGPLKQRGNPATTSKHAKPNHAGD
jgi:hypothetical protein